MHAVKLREKVLQVLSLYDSCTFDELLKLTASDPYELFQTINTLNTEGQINIPSEDPWNGAPPDGEFRCYSVKSNSN